MTAVPVLDTAYFLRWLSASSELFRREGARLTALDAAVGDGDHGANMVRGFDAVCEAVEQNAPATPGELFALAGTTLTNSVGGASGPLFGMALRRTGKRLGTGEPVTPDELAAALRAGAEAVGKLGGAVPGDSTLLDALLPALDAFDGDGTFVAARDAALAGAEATGPMQAKKGRASYLGERSIGHQDAGAHSVVLLFDALVLAADPGWTPAPVAVAEPFVAETAAPKVGRVGVVLVSHSREVAESTVELAKAMVGSGDVAPVYAAGGTDDGRVGTSAERIHAAALKADEGKGVAILCDMGSAVLTVQALLSGTDDRTMPADTRIVDAPFVEGAVGVVVTASVGGDLDMVLAAGEDARNYRKG
ncbi:dihydroxyacetone kinase subunit L [Streptomyces sp. TRM66268-LWL]|uniref:phosphoenolpyruvate--glycerone phosphotransferase n=1 Tax=Streptomyces polyasparticus TaxID=2767826 RepID=A0ABR7SGB1_9ACTN|nr:dihydroxyacetone kinase subunit L [Streptomyces polyasparticus]